MWTPLSTGLLSRYVGRVAEKVTDQPEAGCGGSSGFEGLADVLEQPIGLAKGAGLGGAEGS